MEMYTFLFLILQALLLEALFRSPSSDCRINKGGCEYMCLMEMNGRRCLCRRGYKLLPDGMHCVQASASEYIRSQKLGEMNTEIYPITYPSTPKSIEVPYNPCRPNPCDHICTIEYGRYYRCRCRIGYTLHIDGKRCTAIGNRYMCRVPDVQNGDYGRYVSDNFEKVTEGDFIGNAEVLTLRCHKGYAPFPRQSNDSREGFFEGEIKCEDRIWSKILSCHSSSCSYVPRIKSDSSIDENEHQKRNHGDVITYAFWDDSTLIEKDKVKCHFGEWIGTPTEITDELITCSKFETSSGVEVSYTEGFSVGSYALFSCSSRSTLEGESYAVCLNNGTWSHSLPRCKGPVTCIEFQTTPGLQVSYSKGVSVGSKATFKCSPPDTLYGKSYAVCLINGSWSSSPQCRESTTCPEFGTLQGLEVKYTNNLSVGGIASFSCSPPSTLVGNSHAICQDNRTWSHPLPSCEGTNTCSEVETLQGLEVKYTNNLSVGSIASFSCTPPSTLVGNSHAICQDNRTWSHPLPSCEGSNGCYLKQPESSKLLIDPMKENYSFGDIINLGCSRGHKLTRAVERLMCLGHQWSDNLPDCEKV